MKYCPEKVWRAYAYARDGMADYQIAGALRIDEDTFTAWKEKYTDIADAVDEGRAVYGAKGEEETFSDFVYDRLPEELVPAYDQLREMDRNHSGKEMIDAVLTGHGTRARQWLFLQALVDRQFNVSAACRMVGVKQGLFDRWKKDPNFQGIIAAMLDAKKDFFEGCLVRAAAAGSVAAIVHANKTLNRDRGYGDNLKVEMSGELNTGASQPLDIENLPLKGTCPHCQEAIPHFEILRFLLDSIQSQQQAGPPVTIDAAGTSPPQRMIEVDT